MAAASSSSVRPHWKYDVFISFRGEDTRENFVSHLYAALCRKKIETYMDERLERGDKISNALLEAIEESKISIIVFSRNYANSSWCLDELVHILKCNQKNGQVIIPIFYHVDPSHVRKQQESYGNAFALHDKRFKDTLVRQWRDALTTVANLSGWDSPVTRPESTLIVEVVADILKKLYSFSPSEDLRGLVGIEKHLEQMEKLLDIGSPDIKTLGIWGPGGIGKTTLARVVYNRLSTQFESCCFLANVREESEKRGLNYLEEKLLADLLEEDCNQNMVNSVVKDRLRRTKVLIVLDDVDDVKQVDQLVRGCDQFGNGSRIIVTTRDSQMLRNIQADGIYEVEPLEPDEAFQLIVNNAFGNDSSMIDSEYIWLTQRLIKCARGLPLACKVMGAHLRGKSRPLWESALSKLEQVSDTKIEDVLRISFDALDETEKQIFLDIACFFKGENRDSVQKILDSCDFYADIGIQDLIDKCLITIENNKLWMHNLLQTMGRNIVRQESKSPEKRSRLSTAEDICDVLKKNKGTDAIEGISLNVSDIEKVSLAHNVFREMENLRILRIHDSYNREDCKISFPQGLQMLPDKLRYLHWDAYPLSYLPSEYTPNNLVQLQMPRSELEQLWTGVADLSSLRGIDLSWSKRLTKIADLSKASKLEAINLQHCTSLLEVPINIEHLENVKILNFEYCSSIKDLPKLPTSLESLELSGTGIQELPSSIGLLCSLKELHMKNCESLTSVPDNIHKLISLQDLDLSNCSKLEKLPEILEPMKLLTRLQLNKTAIKEIPASWIKNLVGLEFLNLDMCKNLELVPDGIHNMTSLQGITLRGCSKVEVLAKLPLYLKYLNTHGCTSLKTVLSSRTTLSKDWDEYQLLGGRFVFYGCFKLDQYVFHNIMAEAQRKIFARAITSSKRDRSTAVSSFGVCCPGNKLPNWLKYQSRGSSISIQLRQTTDFLGFALCALVNSKDSSGFDGDLNLVCRLSCITENNDSLSWESCSVWSDRLPSLGCGRWGLCRDFNWGSNGSADPIANSSHVFFWDDYSHRMLVNNITEKNEMNPSGTSYNSVTQASFEFICVDKNRERLEGWNVEKCAVHFLYRQDAKEFHKTAVIIPSRL